MRAGEACACSVGMGVDRPSVDVFNIALDDRRVLDDLFQHFSEAAAANRVALPGVFDDAAQTRRSIAKLSGDKPFRRQVKQRPLSKQYIGAVVSTLTDGEVKAFEN